MSTRLRLATSAPEPEQRPDLYAYEAEQRRRIAAIRWDQVHIRGDRAPALALPASWRSPR